MTLKVYAGTPVTRDTDQVIGTILPQCMQLVPPLPDTGMSKDGLDREDTTETQSETGQIIIAEIETGLIMILTLRATCRQVP